MEATRPVDDVDVGGGVDDPRLLRVGELARACGKSVRALHLYEELGLLQPEQRRKGGFRLYSPGAVDRVDWICKLQDMGFSLSEIKDFLHSWEGSGGMQRVRAVFEEKLRETRENLARLQRLEGELEASLEYLATCRVCGTEGLPPATACIRCDQKLTGGQPPDLVAGLTDAGVRTRPLSRTGRRPATIRIGRVEVEVAR